MIYLPSFSRRLSTFSEGKEDFTVNDSFGGVMPIVLDHNFLIGKKEAVRFSVDILLDSNVVSYLHRYVTDSDGRFRESQRGIATRQLIRKFTEYFDRGWDINPVFYLLEAVSKNDFQTVYPHAQALGHSVMKLQHMNHKSFLETGRVEVDEAKLAGSADSFASSSLEALSASNVLHFSTSSLVPELRYLTNVVYAALLKIVIVDRQRATAAKKLEEFIRFLHTDIGLQLSWEAILGCLKFGGRAGSFLSAKKDPTETRRALLASAWDLLLLRLPSLVLANEDSSHTSLCYVCTAEKALQQLGMMRTIKQVASASLKLPAVMTFDAEALEQEVGGELAKRLSELTDPITLSTIDRTPITEHGASSLSLELENQL